MISAVSGIVMSRDDALIVLGALEAHERLLAGRRDADMPANLRIVLVNLRRAVNKTGDSDTSARNIASNARSIARNRTLQTNSAHDRGYATLSSAEAAAALGITPNAVRDLRRRGRVRAERIGARWRFNAADIERRAKE